MRKNFSINNLPKWQSKGIMIALVTIIFSGMIYLPMSCKKVDDTIDKVLNFDGLFSSSDGWEVELEGSSAKVTKVGTPRGSTTIGVGDYTMTGMTRTSNNSWSGTVADKNFENYVSGTATISGNVLTVTPSGYSSYSFTKSSTGGTGTGTVTPTPTGADTILDIYVDGSIKEKKEYYYNFKKDNDVKTIEIITTEGMTADGKNANHNTADLFVSAAPKKPTVTSSPYTWDAEKSSTNINRISEKCTFSNPLKDQTYNILIYDNNTFFLSRLIIIITK